MKLINCDLGECLIPDPDEIIMPLIDVANIACGGHTGDELSMAKTVELAKQYNVKIAAHPSYPDKENFGRISQNHDDKTLFLLIQHQVEGLMSICQHFDMSIDYLKPHGALYHDMLRSPSTMEVICKVIMSFETKLSLILQAGSESEHITRLTRHYDIELIGEAFADRAYRGNQLIPRSEQGALIEKAEDIIMQYRSFSTRPAFSVDTVCFHSDHQPSVAALQMLKAV